MGKHCDDAYHDIYSYLDQEMPWFKAWRLSRHLKACDGCEQAFSFEQRLRMVLRTCLREDMPPEFLTRLRQAIDNERFGR